MASAAENNHSPEVPPGANYTGNCEIRRPLRGWRYGISGLTEVPVDETTTNFYTRRTSEQALVERYLANAQRYKGQGTPETTFRQFSLH